ncbi:MAG: hypothetical protein ACQEXQ_29555 [Bacillota bacterium]
MRLKLCIISCVLLILTGLTACGSGQSLNEKEKQQIIEQVKKLETSEYDLFFFKINYDEYLARVEGVVRDSYLESVSDRIIFGYDGTEYTSENLIGMPQDELDKHKEHMLKLITSMGFDQQKVTIQFSEIYDSEQENQVYLYTSETKEVKDKPETKTNKKYTLDLLEGRWIITSAEQDKITFGSEQTPEENQLKLKEQKYQKHEGQAIKYKAETLILQGIAED